MWVEETKNGKYKFIERYEDYLTGKQKRVSVTMEKNTPQTRKAAQRAIDAKIEQAMCKHKEHSITLKELVEAYRADQKVSVKKSTYTRNFHQCNTILSVLGENTIAERMTAQYVRERFLSTGKEAGTINEHLVRFRALIRWGYQNDLLPDISFLDKVKPLNDIPHNQKIQDKFLEADELKRLLSGMDEPVWKLLTEFLALSGLRCGEALALNKSDVDIKNSTIYVTKTYDSVNEEITTTKTQCSTREVFMQDELKSVCKKINSLMLRIRLMYSLGPTNLFLISCDGGYIHYYAYNKYLKENTQRILGRVITPHALRHTHASLLLEQGVSIDTISRRLGHENSKVTREIYLHVTEKLKEKDNLQIAQVNIL